MLQRRAHGREKGTEEQLNPMHMGVNGGATMTMLESAYQFWVAVQSHGPANLDGVSPQRRFVRGRRNAATCPVAETGGYILIAPPWHHAGAGVTWVQVSRGGRHHMSERRMRRERGEEQEGRTRGEGEREGWEAVT